MTPGPLRAPLRIAAAVALSIATACADAIVGAAPTADHSAVFDDLWHQVDLHYSFFDLKHINWDSIGASYRPRALAATSDERFAVVLSQMLAQLHDSHVSITPEGVGSTMRYVSSAELVPTYVDSRLIFTRYVLLTDSTADGHVRFGYVAPTVGYVRIPSFEGSGWDGDMDVALRQLPNAHALIIDVRDNSGGDYNLAADIASRFTDSRRVYGYIRRRNGPSHSDFTADVPETIEPKGTHFAGSVYVLANRHAFSSAEDFVLAMRAIPTATIVGDTTGGASGGPITRELPNGWSFQLSEWIEYTPEHAVFDGVGLAPDIVVKATAADYARSVDAALVRAIDLASR
jgi:hypothetical protein